MTDIEQREIFSRNLSRYIELSRHTRKEVADVLGFNYKTCNGWCNGISMPSMGKVQKIADYFHIGKSALLDEKSGDEDPYYLDPEAAAIAQDIFKSPELRVLFDAARDVKPEDLQVVQSMVEALRRKEQGE